jgi:predicted dehydrogenase
MMNYLMPAAISSPIFCALRLRRRATKPEDQALSRYPWRKFNEFRAGGSRISLDIFWFIQIMNLLLAKRRCIIEFQQATTLMKTEIGIGVIGCGGMGMAIVRRIVALSPQLKIKGVYDPDPRSVQSALEELPERPVPYGTYQELLEDPTISWVMIASWNSFHCEQAVAAFKAGKHVFCQKPLGITLQECLEMVQAWRESGMMFNIGFTLRYSPHYRRIRSLIEEGAIGDVISMEFNETLDFCHGGYIMGDWRRLRKNSGTHILEKCCHDIDLANWMMGSRPKRVASFGGLSFFKPVNAGYIERLGKNSDGVPAYGLGSGLVGLNPFESDKDIIDNQVAIIEYANSARASFHTNCNSAIPERRMVILGSEGTLITDVIKGTIHLRRIGFDTVLEDQSTNASGGHGAGDEHLAKELVDSMLYGNPPAAGMMEGLESAITCFAIDEAMDNGTVVDLASYWKQADRLNDQAPMDALIGMVQ